MPIIVKVWDSGAEKPGYIEMVSLKAKEAVQRDPKRYSYQRPEPAPQLEPVQQPVLTDDTPQPEFKRKPGRPPKGTPDDPPPTS